MQEIKNIIESLLFVAEEPLTVEKLRTILETAETKDIQSALNALSEEYDQRGGGFMLRQVAGGWQIRSRPDYNEWIKRMLQPSPQRLSRAALETLAVIAYKQPIIRADIEHIRGVDCGGVLRQLMERKIIRVLGRKEIAGRPLIYATTKLFLEMFDLKDLNDLPTPKEIAELGNAMIDSQQESAPGDSVSELPPPQQDDAADQWADSGDDTDASTIETEIEALAPTASPAPMPGEPAEDEDPLQRETPAESEAEELEVPIHGEAAAPAEDLVDESDTGLEDPVDSLTYDAGTSIVETKIEPPAQTTSTAAISEAPPEDDVPLPPEAPAEPEAEQWVEPPEDIVDGPDVGHDATAELPPLEVNTIPRNKTSELSDPDSEDRNEPDIRDDLDDDYGHDAFDQGLKNS